MKPQEFATPQDLFIAAITGVINLRFAYILMLHKDPADLDNDSIKERMIEFVQNCNGLSYDNDEEIKNLKFIDPIENQIEEEKEEIEQIEFEEAVEAVIVQETEIEMEEKLPEPISQNSIPPDFFDETIKFGDMELRRPRKYVRRENHAAKIS